MGQINLGKITLVVLLTSCILNQYANAQAAQTDPYGQVSIVSPTAGSLGKYADIPVSYHTGIPQIDIPLYTVKAGPLSMPISVSYHASGLKVIEPASWVGAGWALNAGGVITRTVMGLPDERNTNSGATSVKGYFSDKGYNNYFYTGSDQDWTNFSNGLKDGEPDLFFFNFGGYSGKFFFKDDRTPVVIPSQDIKIIPYYPKDDPSFVPSTMVEYNILGFTIITPDGTNYFFGKTPGFSGTVPPYEIANPYSTYTGATSGNAISSWYLNKISTADSIFSINLTYTAESYGYYTISTNTLDSYTTSTQSAFNRCEFSVVKNIEQGLRLSQISFPNGSITFNGGSVRTDLSDDQANTADNVNANATTLGSIQINNTNSSFCKKFLFSYGYFTDNTSVVPTAISNMGYTFSTDKKRLRLDSIQEVSCDNSIQIPSYKFSYFTEMVPRRMNFGLDHWGFYNGVTNNTTTIPTYNTYDGTNINTISGANRNASWPEMRGGALQQITYPTGGTAVFDFEAADDYNVPVTTSQNVTLLNFSCHSYGQSSLTAYGYITTNGNPITVTYNNQSNYPASLTITDASNNQVYYKPIMPENSSNNFLISGVSSGTYTVTIAFPTYSQSNLSGGITCILSQVANVTSYHRNIIGGLRIKTISRKENPNSISPIVTSYSYPNGGFLYSFPTYVQHVRNDLIATVGYYSLSSGGSYQHNGFNNSGCPMGGGFYLKSAGSLRPMATTQGYHIGYPVVKVSQTGNGSTYYNYYTSNTGFSTGIKDLTTSTIDISPLACEASTANTPAAPLPFDYKKGELSSEQYYNENGELLKDVYYYPTYDLNSDKGTPAFIVNARSNGSSGTMYLGTFYTLTAPRRTKLVTTETNYTPGVGSIQQTTTTYYGSPYHNQITRKLVTNSTGDSLITLTKYTPDYRVSSCDATTNCASTYTSDCASCLSTYNANYATCSGSASCITSYYLAYQQCLSTARNNYVSCQFSNYTSQTSTFNSCIVSAKNGGTSDLKPILELQLESRIVPIEITEWKNSNLLHASFIKYDYMTNPSTIPYPTKTRLVNLQAVSSSFSDATVSGNGLTTDSRYADEAAYLSNNGNLSQVTNHDGIPLTYLWDYQNAFPIAKISNATADQVAYTSFESDGNGNWTISGTPTADASAPTGNYSYNLSGGNISKSGLNSSNAYVLSYWSKSGSAYTIFGASTNNVKQGKTINGWTFFEHTISGASSVTISGGNYIDVLRLYPSTAQMTTYTYSPLVGITSECDTDNRINYYQYDALGRLKVVKDQDGNIVKTMTYHYRNQTAF